jgi:putative ABC transport system substrate-binding protein
VLRRTLLCAIAASAGVAGLDVRAQRAARVHRIGVLVPGNAPSGAGPTVGSPDLMGGFLEGMRELGYTEGENIVFEWRFANGRLDRLPALAAELVRAPVAVILVAGPSPLRAAMDATKRTPIVMMAASSDPVAEGVAASLARPGGNVTGLTYAVTPERFGKQLELLRAAAPRVARIAVWWDSDLESFHRSWAVPLHEAARQLDVQVLAPVQVLQAGGVDPAFATLRQQGADALLVAIAGAANSYRARLATGAIENRLATMSAQRAFTREGGLISYGPDFRAIYRRAATYVDKILKGANAAELAIELPTYYELAINLKTAAALGLAIPQSLLLRADEVVQ